MGKTILSILEFVRESLPYSLIDKEGYARLAAVAERLPAEMTTFWGFECRLGQSDAKADILFQTINKSQGQRLLAGHTPSPLDIICDRWPAWRRLRTFAGLWSDPNHPLHAYIHNIWLEFDTASTSSVTQVTDVIAKPSIFFGPKAKALDKKQLFDLIVDAIAALGENYPKCYDKLKSFITSLPEGAQLFQIGLMLSRANEGLRVCVKELSPEYIPDWLSEIEWNGDTGAVAGLLRKIVPMLNSLAVNLNLTQNGAAEKIGLECYMDWLVDDPAQWHPLLEFIEEEKLCLPQKREGLLAFPGIGRSPITQRITSDGILFSNLYRKLHHIKLNIVDSNVVTAKAYLALSRPGVHLKRVFGKCDGPWLAE